MTKFIYCASGNPKYAQTALKFGWIYGSQMPSTVYYHPQFIDQNWKKPDLAKYLERIKQYQPETATVLDLEHESQFEEVMQWVEAIAPYVTKAVIIIPKVMGIIDRIPEQIAGKQIILGYSVPTTHGGTSVPLWEFGNRPVHLLGGSATKQFELMRYLNVVSVDNNYNAAVAQKFIKFYAQATHHYLRESIMETLGIEDEPLACFKLSLMNMNAQRAGFIGLVRYAVPADIPSIKKIASKYSSQLGFVNRASLEDSIKRLSLIVAMQNGVVVGFANYRPRKDGVNVIYELATHPNRLRQKVGSALLSAVPYPTRLKTTTDNESAITFYEANGFTITSTEQGRKRMLHIMERPSPYPLDPLSFAINPKGRGRLLSTLT